MIRKISAFRKRLIRMEACARLARDVERRKQLVAKYPQRRASAKLGWARRKGVVS